MDKQNIRIHLRAYDNKILDLSTIEIILKESELLKFLASFSPQYPRPIRQILYIVIGV